MHAVVEAQTHLAAIPRGHDEPRGRWIERAGRFYGLTFSQAKKIIYGEVKDLRASRLDAMRALRDQLEERATKRRETLNDIAIGIAAAKAAVRDDARGAAAGMRAALGDRPSEGSRGDGSEPSGGRGVRRDEAPSAAAAVPGDVDRPDLLKRKRYWAG